MKLKSRETTWKEAFMASPGPRSKRAAMLLTLKGLCMGAADTVPGVSGGTVALITGIYEQLLAAIKSFDVKAAVRILSFDLKGAIAELHVRFLFSLLLGIGIAIFSLARLMKYLLQYQPVPTWSLFFGLIAASIWAVGRKVERWGPATGGMFGIGTVFAFFLVGMMPATTPETLWFIFLSGMLAICAMILPGISGAFVLLILGKYDFILSAVENPFLPRHLVILAVFMTCCAIGLAGFSRVLKYLLERFRPGTLAFLTGLMLGSMRKIWPWKEAAITELIHGKAVVLKESNMLPEIGPDLVLPIVLMITGFVAVVLLERLSEKGADQSLPR